MTRPNRPCLDCGILTRSTTSRCGLCQRTRERRRNQIRASYYNSAHRRHSLEERQRQPWCSVCATTTDLTWDHEHGQVECRSCNSAHRRNPR